MFYLMGWPSLCPPLQLFCLVVRGSGCALLRFTQPLRISARMILDIMLEQLGIPKAVYRRRTYSHNRMSVTLCSSAPLPRVMGACPAHMSITGIHSADGEIAEDTAAVEAIRYIEQATNTMVKDLNYERLQKMQQQNGFLELQLYEAFDMINRLARLCVW